MEKDYILSLKGITKVFPGVKALDDVTINVERGTIHGLVGENGAGKSTLIKVLAGIYQPEKGEVVLEGQVRKFASPIAARRAGISVVHQEIKLSETLSVAENMFLGNIMMKGKIVDWAGMRKRAQEIVDDLGMDIDINAQVSSLTVAKKQIVEIMHAINNNAHVLIMDEPSAVLTDRELEVMFRIVKQLRENGITIIYISHRLDEVFQITDRIQVMRDGCRVADLNTAETNKNELIAHMVGREVTQMYPERDQSHIGDVVLKVENLSSSYIKDVSFDVRAGEIVGFFGLMGAGRTEIVEMAFGARKKTAGKIFVNGQEMTVNNPADGKVAGMGYVPSDRKGEGLFLTQSVAMNISNNVLNDISNKIGVLDFKKEAELVNEWIDALRIKTPSMETLTNSLSGGNQQKVVLAKWLTSKPKILILNEPTRGIDVGAKAEIYNLINELSKQGIAFIMVSSELPEVMAMSDRVVVIHEGRYKGTVMREDFTQERLLATAIGGENE